MARRATADAVAGRDGRPGTDAGGAACDLALFGLDGDIEALYRVVLRYAGEPTDVLSDRTGVPEHLLAQRLQPLVGLGLVRVAGGRVHAEPPGPALGRLVGDRARVLQDEEERLAAARAAIPDFVAAHERGHADEWLPVSIELIESGDLVSTMESLVRNSTGELLFFRPDQYSLPSGQQMDEVVLRALRDGRPSRVLYPASICDEVPERVRARALAGERVRVVRTVPGRMAVFGGQGAVITEEWGTPVGRRLLVRQPAVVSALAALFDAHWQRGTSLPGLGEAPEPGYQQLLGLLARGAKDEQIARLLGTSLRTVRRRIATLMADLGVESRFQAGMEAVRRGLL